MFERDHHVRIATILQALDDNILLNKKCFFGGGTAIVLTHGEYRESLDIDFMVSDKVGFRDLRGMLTAARGISPLVRKGFQLTQAREIRADQYGIRTMLAVGGAEIKFEIVHEGRVDLDSPSPDERICGVTTLTLLDMAVSKLLANSDRWNDDGVFSRDLIDLAMLDLTSEMRKAAKRKAAGAYGESIERDLNKAVESLKKRRGRLAECMTTLKMERIAEAQLWEKIRTLAKG